MTWAVQADAWAKRWKSLAGTNPIWEAALFLFIKLLLLYLSRIKYSLKIQRGKTWIWTQHKFIAFIFLLETFTQCPCRVMPIAKIISWQMKNLRQKQQTSWSSFPFIQKQLLLSGGYLCSSKLGPTLSGFLPLNVQTNLRLAQLSSHQSICSTSLRWLMEKQLK